MLTQRKLLSETNKYITEDEILANAFVFFIAGYETTATTLSFATYELTLNPDVQQKLYEEVMSSVDTNGEIDYDLLARLTYLDAVVSETLRHHSPAISLGRMVANDYKLGDTGITLKKGQRVIMPVYAIHHMEEFYPEPFKFNPDRFLPENRHKIVPYTYLPFGSGPRNCVGMRFGLMEAKLGLAQVIRRYKFVRSVNTPTQIPLQNVPPLHTPKQVIVGIEKR